MWVPLNAFNLAGNNLIFFFSHIYIYIYKTKHKAATESGVQSLITVLKKVSFSSSTNLFYIQIVS